MTTPNVHCTCTGTCHPATIVRYCASCAAPITVRVDSDDAWGDTLRCCYCAPAHRRILAATDHIGRGTR